MLWIGESWSSVSLHLYTLGFSYIVYFKFSSSDFLKMEGRRVKMKDLKFLIFLFTSFLPTEHFFFDFLRVSFAIWM